MTPLYHIKWYHKSDPTKVYDGPMLQKLIHNTTTGASSHRPYTLEEAEDLARNVNKFAKRAHHWVSEWVPMAEEPEEEE